MGPLSDQLAVTRTSGQRGMSLRIRWCWSMWPACMTSDQETMTMSCSCVHTYAARINGRMDV